MKDMFHSIIMKCGFHKDLKVFGIQTCGFEGHIFVLDACFCDLLRFYKLASFRLPTSSQEFEELKQTLATILALKEKIKSLLENTFPNLKKLNEMQISAFKNMPTNLTPLKEKERKSSLNTKSSTPNQKKKRGKGEEEDIIAQTYDIDYNNSNNIDGRGRQSWIYFGIRRKDKFPVILKNFRESFKLGKKESELLSLVKDIPFVVPLLDNFIPQDSMFGGVFTLVFPQLQPLDFDLLTPNLITLYFSQLLTCLKFLHSRSIVHMDIKPSNIMFDPNSQQIRLIDFGSATTFIFQSNYETGKKESILPILGTDGYIAPELLKEEEEENTSATLFFPDKVDIYSSGIVFLRCVIREILSTKGIKFDFDFNSLKPLWNNKSGDYLDKAISLSLNSIEKWKSNSKQENTSWLNQAIDLLHHLIHSNPFERYSSKTALNHSFFQQFQENQNNQKSNSRINTNQVFFKIFFDKSKY